MITIEEVREEDTCLGLAKRICLFDDCSGGYRRQLSWEEIWYSFEEKYPGKWAIQVFPPKEYLLNDSHTYHLYVLEKEPQGFNLLLLGNDKKKGTWEVL